MNIRIVTDSSANLFTTPEKNIVSVPITLRTDEKEFMDNDALDTKEMIEYLASYKGKSGSACPSSQDWIDAFGDAEYIIGLAISSNLSGSFNSLRIAKEEYEEAHPERKVFIIDSLSTGPEMKLLIEKIQELDAQGLSFEEITNVVTEYQNHTEIIFMLKSITNLANNGRVSPAIAKITSVLNIIIIGIASAEGTIEQKEKARGEKRALAAMKKVMENIGYKGGKMRIDHTFNPEDAEKLKNNFLEIYPDADIIISENRGLCSFYSEMGGIIIGYEK